MSDQLRVFIIDDEPLAIRRLTRLLKETGRVEIVGETTEPAWVPTSDSPQCFVGYRCRESDLELFGR